MAGMSLQQAFVKFFLEGKIASNQFLPRLEVLITSRPNFSLDLHGLANRVEILGFTKGDIHDYFENVLKSMPE